MEKKIAFCKNDQVEGKRIQTNLKKDIKAAKVAYREKVELQFQPGNMPEACKGTQTLTAKLRPKHVVTGYHRKKEKITVNSSTHSTAVSPVLFTVYTDDCRGSEECPVVTFSDDTAIIDLSNSFAKLIVRSPVGKLL